MLKKTFITIISLIIVTNFCSLEIFAFTINKNVTTITKSTLLNNNTISNLEKNEICHHTTLYEFDDETKAISGVYEGNTIENLIDSVKEYNEGEDAVVLKNDKEVDSGVLEVGMEVRIYHKGKLYDEYVIRELLKPFDHTVQQTLGNQSQITKYANQFDFTLPVDNIVLASQSNGGNISQYYSSGHKAIDIARGGTHYSSSILGANIRAISSGTVIASVTNYGTNSYGNYTKIDHGNGIKTLYAHMQYAPIFSVGDIVLQGQVIGQVGNTGNSSGPHLHFEIIINGEKVDPLYYLNEAGNFVSGNPIGSYDGAEGGAGTVRVYGWAFDYDEPSTSISIHIYVGGTAGSPNAIGYDVGATSVYQPNVNSTYGITGNHAFDFTISTSKRGTQEVYVYAINVGTGTDTLLGCKTVNVSTGDPVGAMMVQ